VVIDLYSRHVVGWSMKPTLAREIVLDALLMAIWRRRPKQEVIIHSDQGSSAPPVYQVTGALAAWPSWPVASVVRQ
jgi:transposase InsO family protein